ncbi:similar to VNSP I (predicted), isoform CRA_b, partial [Rattus norvegicus]
MANQGSKEAQGSEHSQNLCPVGGGKSALLVPLTLLSLLILLPIASIKSFSR